MIRYIAILAMFLALPALYAQNPVTATYPGAVTTDEDFPVAKNFASTTLTSGVDASTLSLPVADATVFRYPTILVIDSEVIKACSGSGVTVTVCAGGRGLLSTAASHSSAVTVANRIVDYYHLRAQAEIIGIQTALGAGLSNVAAATHAHAASDITSGQLALARGGTGADLSATGGANQFVKQSSLGGALSVGSIADADVPDTITASNYLPLSGGTMTGNVVLADGVNAQSTDVTFYARKGSVGTLAKGTPVYIIGYNVGGWYEVEAADADDLAALPVAGVTNEAITNSATGVVVEVGEITGLDTSSYSAGDVLFVSTTAGQLTTSPVGQIARAALVLRSNASQGVIIVNTLTPDDAFTRDSEWDTIAEIEAATSVNILVSTEQNAGTDITADLEEEAHSSEHSENAADEILGENLGTACSANQILKADATGGLVCAADDTGGSPTFDGIGAGTNTTAAMVVGTGASLSASGSGSITATAVAADSVPLTTGTTGNYVASVATTSPITGGAAGSEGASLTIALSQNAGTDVTTDLEEETHASEHAENAADEILVENLGTACTSGEVAASDGAGGLSCTTVSASSGTPNYTESFSSQTSVSMTNAEHGFGHANLLVQCFDNASPRGILTPNSVTVNTSTYEVIATFSTAQSGSCTINGSATTADAVTYKIQFIAGSCQNSSPALAFNTTSSSPAAACVTGSNTVYAEALFDAATDEFVVDHLQLRDAASALLDIRWRAAATTGNVVWALETACVADGEVGDPSWNAAQTVTDAAKGTTLQWNDAQIASVTLTGCAVDEELFFRFRRDADNGSDTMAGDAGLISLRFTIQ